MPKFTSMKDLTENKPIACDHEEFKIAERLFNKFGKPVATAIFCLKCGSSQKILEPKKTIL